MKYVEYGHDAEAENSTVRRGKKNVMNKPEGRMNGCVDGCDEGRRDGCMVGCCEGSRDG